MVKPELRNQFLHQSWPYNRVMLSQSSSSPQDPHPGLPYCTYFIANEYSYCGSFWRPTKAVTVGKKQPWSSATSWSFHQEVHAWFSSFPWTFCPAAHLLCLCLPRSRIRISHSPPSPQGGQCVTDPSALFHWQTVLLGAIKAHCRWESKNKMDSLRQAPSYPTALSLGNKSAASRQGLCELCGTDALKGHSWLWDTGRWLKWGKTD